MHTCMGELLHIDTHSCSYTFLTPFTLETPKVCIFMLIKVQTKKKTGMTVLWSGLDLGSHLKMGSECVHNMLGFLLLLVVAVFFFCGCGAGRGGCISSMPQNVEELPCVVAAWR